ncbi:TPA: Gfo/Idh/MocA family oxidoreductase, partial [Candidatus Bathyarchaeota archaeon]|nr:Gfo/Idh/MocA family oxidoreductase [Candidatus Bathyarchaeota archaeon]
MSRVRIGTVGLGGIFRGAHLPAYVEVEEAQLVAICDVSERALKRAEETIKRIYNAKAKRAEEEGKEEDAKRLIEDVENITSYNNLEEMLSKEDLDLIDICTPTKFHSPLAIRVLESGSNVMVEKPMARTYLECLDVIDAVKESGKLYQHNENWLYSPLWYNLKKIIESGVIGEPQYIMVSQAHGGPEWATWFWEPDIAGGGALLDNGVHAITIAWFLAGFDMEPKVVKAAEPQGVCIRMKTRILQGMFRPFKVEDDAHVLIRYEDEDNRWVTTLVEGSWSHRDLMNDRVVGTDGQILRLNKNGDTVLRIEKDRGVAEEINLGKVSWVQTFIGEVRNMCNCVLNNVKPICDERVGAETTAIVQAAYLSQKLGKRPVTLDEFRNYVFKIRDEEGERAPE